MNQLYPWLTSLWKEWQESLEADRFSNSTLLVAEKGMGSEQLVEKFSHAVMCENDKSEACGFCHSCQLMASNSHPDFHVIKPEKEGKSITVEQIRQCNRLAQESSQFFGVRLFVIEPADMMNESAANALLKTLEEPSSSCMFLLVSNGINTLLPTITSRCQQWNQAAPEPRVVTDWLSQQGVGNIPDYVVHINGNAPLSSRTFVEEKKVADYSEIEAALIAVVTDVGDQVALAKTLSKDPIQQLTWLWYLLSDAQKCHFGIEQPFFTPKSGLLAKSISYEVIHAQTQQLSELMDQLKTFPGLNAELLILDWLFKFREDLCL